MDIASLTTHKLLINISKIIHSLSSSLFKRSIHKPIFGQDARLHLHSDVPASSSPRLNTIYTSTYARSVQFAAVFLINKDIRSRFSLCVPTAHRTKKSQYNAHAHMRTYCRCICVARANPSKRTARPLNHPRNNNKYLGDLKC